jgi:hypothetical protein
MRKWKFRVGAVLAVVTPLPAVAANPFYKYYELVASDLAVYGALILGFMAITTKAWESAISGTLKPLMTVIPIIILLAIGAGLMTGVYKTAIGRADHQVTEEGFE